jgi:hypothetical protein
MKRVVRGMALDNRTNQTAVDQTRVHTDRSPVATFAQPQALSFIITLFLLQLFFKL